MGPRPISRLILGVVVAAWLIALVIVFLDLKG